MHPFPAFHIILMSKRLEKIASLVPDGSGVADVGTDHGYLPLLLLKRGYTGNIYATDINAGPLSAARRSISEAGYSERVELMLCDGLSGCEGKKLDTVVIAGMGGDTITGILDRAEWCMSGGYRLILQPATKPEILRYWLVNNEFHISREELIEENGIIYQIISAEIGERESYCDAELFVGKADKFCDCELYVKQLDIHIKRFENTVQGLRSTDRAETAAWLGLSEGILAELKEMRRKYNDDCK